MGENWHLFSNSDLTCNDTFCDLVSDSFGDHLTLHEYVRLLLDFVFHLFCFIVFLAVFDACWMNIVISWIWQSEQKAEPVTETGAKAFGF